MMSRRLRVSRRAYSPVLLSAGYLSLALNVYDPLDGRVERVLGEVLGGDVGKRADYVSMSLLTRSGKINKRKGRCDWSMRCRLGFQRCVRSLFLFSN